MLRSEDIVFFTFLLVSVVNKSLQGGPPPCFSPTDVFENRTACKFENGDIVDYCFMGIFKNDYLCDLIPPVFSGNALSFLVEPIYNSVYDPCTGCELSNAFLPYGTNGKFDDYFEADAIYNITDNSQVFTYGLSFPDRQSGCNCTNDFCKCGYMGLHFNLSSLNYTFNATLQLKIGKALCGFDSITNNAMVLIDVNYVSSETYYAGEFQDTLCPGCCDCSVCPPKCENCAGEEENNPCYLMTKQCGYEGATTTPEIQTDSGVSTTPEIQAVDGSWSDWQPWSTCTTECLQQRTRNCDLPAPQNNGLPCVGSSMQSANCTGDSCNTATVTQDANATAVTVTQDGNATGLNATVEAVGKNTTMEPEATTDPSSIVKAAKNLIFAVLIIKIISTFCV